jgi:hypothetical protein
MTTTGRLAAILLFSLGIAPLGIAPLGIAPLGIAPLGIAPLGIAPPDAAPDAFTVHTISGVDFTGDIKKLAPDGSVELGGPRTTTIAAAHVVSIRRTPLHLPSYPERAVIVLTHGDRVPFDAQKPLKLDDGRVSFSIASAERAEPVRVPRAFIALLWLAVPEATRDSDLLIVRLLKAKRSRDVLLLRNGDQLAGTLTAIDPVKGVRLDTGNREVTVDQSQVSGIAFGTELQARIRVPKTYTHVVLANGGRLSFSAIQMDAGAVKLDGKTLFGARLELPLDQIAGLEPRSARIVYLSDLKPKSYEHTPFLNVSWPLAVDTAVSGGPLRLAGSTFDKGLGVHSKSRVTYALDGEFRWFEALVGLDEGASRRARVRLHVLVDGREQNTGSGKELTGRDAPVPIRIDISKARELTLITDFGSYGDVRAHVDWADARLIR